ncbi:MAG: four helix bundle protein [Cyanobacteria bacterium J06621_8]
MATFLAFLRVSFSTSIPSSRSAIALAQKIYQITRESEDLSGDRSLVDQLRRASVSISANVSEGFERRSQKEYLRFLSIAKGSAGEVRSLITLAYRVGHIDSETFCPIKLDALSISKMLGYHMKQVERRIVATEKKNALAVRHRRSRYQSYPQQQVKVS